jgi:hypothetical protein
MGAPASPPAAPGLSPGRPEARSRADGVRAGLRSLAAAGALVAVAATGCGQGGAGGRPPTANSKQALEPEHIADCLRRTGATVAVDGRKSTKVAKTARGGWVVAEWRDGSHVRNHAVVSVHADERKAKKAERTYLRRPSGRAETIDERVVRSGRVVAYFFERPSDRILSAARECAREAT